MMRVVSLIASSTEIICALGYRDNLVGRSHECDYPESVRELPVCSEPKFNTEGTSVEIDQRVKAIVRDSLSVYRVLTDKLRQLRPDVIVTQDHCEVCAVSLKDVEQAVCEWIGSKPRLVSLRPNALADVWAGMREVARALGNPEKGEVLVQACKQRLDAISEEARQLPESPSVACIEWLDPLMAAGNWIPELLEMLGARDLFGKPGKHAPWMKWNDLLKADPDLIAIMPCGWGIDRTLEEMHTLKDQSRWKDLKAVREGRVFIVDGNHYMNRPGPRLVESMEILAEILYPKTFQFRHDPSVRRFISFG